MSVRWDSAKVAELRRRLRPLTDGAFRKTVYRLLAEEAHHLVRDGFRKSAAPDGTPWKPLRHPGKRRRGGKVLIDTARLRNGFSANATATGFAIATVVKYAAAHNDGATIIRAARVNAHGKNGRFTRRLGEAELALKTLKKKLGKVQRISFTAAHGYKLPQRQMVPDPKRLPKSWDVAFKEAVEDALKRQVGAVR